MTVAERTGIPAPEGRLTAADAHTSDTHPAATVCRIAAVLFLSGIPLGGTVAVLLVVPEFGLPRPDLVGANLDWALPLAVSWAILLGWAGARVRSVAFGLIVFGVLVTWISALAVAAAAVGSIRW